MSNKDLKNTPTNLRVKDETATSWMYEEPTGLEVIVEVEKFVQGQSVKLYHHITIPWRIIRNSLARKDAK